MVIVARMDAVEHRLEPPAITLSGVPQLVRHVGQAARAAAVALEARAHGVEGVRQAAHVAGPPRSGTRPL